MTVKKLTVKGESVDYCIQDALQRIGLPKDQTLVRIHQREKAGLFGYREAVVSVTYNEEQSSEALKSKRLAELHSRLQFRFKAGEAQVKVPGSIYSECNILGEEAVRQVLLDFIAEHKIPDPDEAAITQLIEDNQSHFHFLTIRTFDTVELNHRGAQIHIRKSEDLMEAEALIFHGRNGARLQEVFNVLQAAGIVKGIRKKSIEKVLRSRHCGFFEIAKGCPAIDDRPGDIEKYFHEDEHKEFAKMMEALTIDTRSVKDINIADRNQLLMTIGDIVPGSDGYSIDGAVLRKKVLVEASAGLRMGKNVYASDDGKQVFSKQSGHIVWKADEGLIDVEPLYIVEGNVDFSEGNIIGFVGKVMIKGDVKPKFSVIAEGDIEIHGSVEDAIVRSTTGNIRVAGGIVNNSGGHVEAKELVHCMIMTNAKVRANKIIVEKEVMNSELDAETTIEIAGTPGAVVGGTISARHLIRANIVGSERGVSTVIRVGDVSDLKAKMRGLRQTIDRVNAEKAEAEQVRHILEARKRSRELTDSQKEQLAQALEDIPRMEERLQDLSDEEQYINEEIERRKDGKLEVLKMLHPQTDIHIFDGHFVPNSTEQYTGLRCKKGEVTRYQL